jgi:OmpA-OmpF porin, OOP family
MKLTKTSRALGLAVFAATVCPFALAQTSGWLLGGNVGQANYTIDDAKITSGLQGAGLATSTINDNRTDTGYKLFGGYQFNKNFALEGGYFDLGKAGFTATTVPAGTLNGQIKLRGLNLDAVGFLPITENLSLLGRVGANYAEAKDSFSGTGAVTVANPAVTQSGTNVKYGMGLEYALTKTLALRGELERYRVNDAVGNHGDVDLFSVGLVYRFWNAPAPAAKEKIVYIDRPGEPYPVPVPVLVVLKKVSFDADTFYPFDKAELRPEGKRALNEFAHELKTANFEVVKIVGNTDRLGPHAHNLELSTLRAKVVKDYLVASAGIPADKITAYGVGATNPVTQPHDCVGSTATKAVTACLAPDRRVDIEVSGTQK